MSTSLFEEVLRGLCNFDQYEPDSEDFPPVGIAQEECRNGDSDIPNGFQDIPPQLFIVIGEIAGNVLAGKLPFNMQNALGNWLQLVGQAILTYNAQQQYFLNGPGRYYNPIYRNAGNPFCNSSGTTSDNASNVTPKSSDGSNQSDNKSDKGNDKNKSKNKKSDIDSLAKELEKLKSKIEKLRNE